MWYAVKNFLPWKRGKEHSKMGMPKKKPDLTGGGNSSDVVLYMVPLL